MPSQIVDLSGGIPEVDELHASGNESAANGCGCFCYVSDPKSYDEWQNSTQQLLFIGDGC
jgi:hypothetical protein